MIKAVLFDVDGVLIDSFDANLKFYNDLAIDNGYKPLSKTEFVSLFPSTMLDVIKKITQASDEEVKRMWEEGKEKAVNYPYDMLGDFEGAEEAVKILSIDYILGIVTSRINEGIFRIPLIARLNKYFKVVIGYQDTEKHKPNPEPLLLACEKLKIKPEEAVYIGDQEIDLIAGKKAGMKTILFSKEKFGNPDLYTSSLEDLPKLISML